ncbi:hypothetical protein [Gemmatimonas sp.]|uniref:hypothetical protein n=1 Tax=Gemmatimonas sp. TaxID=1962908 RepID=UPI003DA36FA6
MSHTSLTPTSSSAVKPLHEILDAIDRAESTDARVQLAATLLYEMGFDRVMIILRDPSLNPTFVGARGDAGIDVADRDGAQAVAGCGLAPPVAAP